MNFWKTTALLIGLGVLPIWGANTPETITFTTGSGIEYKEVVITKVEPDGITVMFNSGATKISFLDLPESLQRKYGYDRAKANAYSAKMREEVREVENRKRIQMAIEKLDETIKDTAIEVQLKVDQILKGGALCTVSIVKTSEETYEVEKNSLANLILKTKEYETKTRTVRSVLEQKEQYFVIGLPGHLLDGDEWSGKLYECGTYPYTSPEGQSKTLHRYATSVEWARNTVLARRDEKTIGESGH